MAMHFCSTAELAFSSVEHFSVVPIVTIKNINNKINTFLKYAYFSNKSESFDDLSKKK